MAELIHTPVQHNHADFLAKARLREGFNDAYEAAELEYEAVDRLCKETVHNYLEQEEIEKRFLAAAIESRQHFQQTGLHTTHEEFSHWVDQLQTNPRPSPLVGHV